MHKRISLKETKPSPIFLKNTSLATEQLLTRTLCEELENSIEMHIDLWLKLWRDFLTKFLGREIRKATVSRKLRRTKQVRVESRWINQRFRQE